VRCVLVATYAASWSLFRGSPALWSCVSACVSDLGTSTNSYSTLSLSAAPQKEGNINFTYRNSNSNLRLLPAARQCCCFSRVVSFLGIFHNLQCVPQSVASEWEYLACVIVMHICSAHFDRNTVLITSFSRVLNIQGGPKTFGQKSIVSPSHENEENCSYKHI